MNSNDQFNSNKIKIIFDLRYTRRMKTYLRNVIAVLALVLVVYIVTNYAGQFQQQIGVKGASTSRNQGIAGQLSHDVGSQVDTAKDQAMNVSLSDVISYLSRFQRIPKDISNIKEFVQTQVNNVVESRNKKQ